MSIILPENYHATKELEKRNVHCIARENAVRQDIRPLRIGILNIMPKVETYEFNLLYPLGRSIIQIEPVWIRLNSHHYKSSNKSHLDELYISFEDAIKEGRGFDGLIITGAPVEEIAYEKVRYWDELSEIFKFAKENISSSLGICWGGLALAKFLEIEKELFQKKIFGVYPTKNINRGHRVTGELDDIFYCPQSRHAGISDSVMEFNAKKGVINLLAYSAEAGYTIFESKDSAFIMHLGHPEYETHRLVDEYKRDKLKGRDDVFLPKNLDIENPMNIWRGHSLEFFRQWIKEVYLKTPYNIDIN